MIEGASANLGLAVVKTPGLGNRTYLLGSGDEAVIIDPPRDAWRAAAVSEQRGWRIRYALETHVHNDYLSGARELERAYGTRIVAPDEGGYRFSHDGAREGHVVEVGDLALVARATPGHTPEHLSWEVQDEGGTPVALFSGGSLLIGGVGRTDLLGESRLAELTNLQYATMRRIEQMPDDVVVYPTHGVGSFCVAGDAAGPSSATVGSLRLWNRAFSARDREAFEQEVVAGRTLYPAYYKHMAPLNREGPRILGGAREPKALTAADVTAARDAGAWIVDVRDRSAFAAGHIQGSLNVEAEDSLSAYVGWLVPFDAPICLVANDASQGVAAATELALIGYDHVVGRLDGGVDAWADSGGSCRSYPTSTVAELAEVASGTRSEPSRILDVRQPYEWRGGALPRSDRIFVADLPEAIPRLDRDISYIVTCRTGARATIAASLLDAAGLRPRPVVDGGVPDLRPESLRPATD